LDTKTGNPPLNPKRIGNELECVARINKLPYYVNTSG
jgi:hypothetical protein